MVANKHGFAAIGFVLTILALAPQPCGATAITLDLKNVVWNFDNSSVSFDLRMLGARGDLTYALNPASSSSSPVAAAYSAVEKALVVRLDDRPDWQLWDVRADLHFNGGALDVTVSSKEVRYYRADPNSGAAIQARQTSWTGAADPFAGYAWWAPWGGTQNVHESISTFHYTFQNDSSLFSPRTVIPAAFLDLPTYSADTSGGFMPFNDSFGSPEPASLVLVGAGLLTVAIILRQRRQGRATVPSAD